MVKKESSITKRLSGLVVPSPIAATIMVGTTRIATRSWQKFVRLLKMETAKKPNA